MLAAEFASVSPHPYGVLPGGNIYMGDNQKAGTTKRQDVVKHLSDELWQQILSYCNGPSLGCVVQTCRELYVGGHQPELWRDLVLRDISKRDGNLLQVSETWRDTYVQRLSSNSNDGNGNGNGNSNSNSENKDPDPPKKFSPHVPIPVRGVYSDIYFRTHLCRSFGLPSSWMKPSQKKGDVPRVKDISISDFLTKYEQPNRPVVFAGAAKSWPACEKWKHTEYLKTSTRNQVCRATSAAAPLSANFTMESYSQYCRSRDLEEAPLYLFDRSALLEGPLGKDCMVNLKDTCPYFDPGQSSQNGGHDLFQHLGEGRRPDHTWLIVGPKRSGSAFHMDPNATHAWNAAIVGRKRWIFYPPGVTPPGVHPSPSGDEVAMPISIGEWLINYGPEHERQRHARGALECTVEPGDVLFVPHGWWHMVVNLDDVNIAVTHNYVSRSNLPTVLRFLQKKQDQVSGCRDRAESIKPQQLFAAFTGALQKVHPEWLSEAQTIAKQGWKCRAWTDRNNDETDAPQKKVPTNKRKRRQLDDAPSKFGNSVMARAKIAPIEKKTADESASTGGFSFSFL